MPSNCAAIGEHDFSRSARRQELLDKLFVLARTADDDATRVSAAVAWLNRYEGKPVAMTAHASAADLSALNDAELEHELRLHAARIQAERQKN